MNDIEYTIPRSETKAFVLNGVEEVTTITIETLEQVDELRRTFADWMSDEDRDAIQIGSKIVITEFKQNENTK